MDDIKSKLKAHRDWMDDQPSGKPLRIKRECLAKHDFSKECLSDAMLSHCDLSGCKFGNCVGANFACSHGQGVDFSGADISNSSFELADMTGINLIGAIWGGETIDAVSVFSTPKFWVLVTNIFVQIGCMQWSWHQIEEMEKSHDLSRVGQETFDVDGFWKWWDRYGTAIKRNRDKIDSVDGTGEKCEWLSQWSHGMGYRWLQITNYKTSSEPAFDPNRLGMTSTTICGK